MGFGSRYPKKSPPGTGRPGSEDGDDSRGGSGLGLSIVQAIAHAHGGQAILESWPGRGTRVRIWLPARAAPPAVAADSVT